MKIIRWLLSHIFLILLIIVVIYSYMFWGNLTGNDTPAGKAISYLSEEFVAVDNFVNAVKARQAKPDGQQAQVEQQLPASTSSQAVVKPDDTKAAAAGIEQPPVSISYSQNSARVEQDSAGHITTQPRMPGDETTIMVSSGPTADNDTSGAAHSPELSPEAVQQAEVGSSAMVAETEEVFVTPEIEQQLQNVDESGKVLDETLQGSDVRDMWITARKAFYQRNYELSENTYKRVIASTVDNFDAYGELGNVYFNQGKNEQAASAYYQAAAILVSKGQVDRVRSLVGLLQHLDKSKAVELQNLLDSVAQ